MLQLHQRKRKTPPLDEEEPHPQPGKRSRQGEYFNLATNRRAHSHTHTITAESPLSEPSSPPSSHNESIDSETVEKEVELQLRPHPSHPAVLNHAIRNLVTSPLCTVSHLTKYLSLHPLLDKTVHKNKGQQ